MNLGLFPGRKIGIDLGTKNSVAAIDRKVAANEPTLIAEDARTNETFFGREAERFIGLETEGLTTTWPMIAGKVSNSDDVEKYLTNILRKLGVSGGSSLANQTIVVAIPCKLEDSYRSAVYEICSRHAREVILVDQPVAAAIGQGVDLEEVRVVKILDIGGGTTDAIAINKVGVIRNSSAGLAVAGNDMDRAIVNWIYEHHKIKIGESFAQDLKHHIGCAPNFRCGSLVRIKGYDALGQTRTARITGADIGEAIRKPLERIVEFTRNWFSTLVQTSCEALITLEEGRSHTNNVIEPRPDHLVFTGGVSLLKGLDVWLAGELNLPVKCASNPLELAAIGASIIANDRKLIQRYQVQLKKYGKMEIPEVKKDDRSVASRNKAQNKVGGRQTATA